MDRPQFSPLPSEHPVDRPISLSEFGRMNAAAAAVNGTGEKMEEEGRKASSSVTSVTTEEDFMIPSSEARRALLGPFSPVLGLCGFDLEHSMFSRNKRPLPQAVISTVIFFVFIGLIVWRTITLMRSEARPFSYAWADSNVAGFMGLYGFGSAVMIGRWTAIFSLPKFYTALVKCVPKSRERPLHERAHYIQTCVFSAIFIAITMVASVKSTVQRIEGAINATVSGNSTATAGDISFFSPANFFGLEPILALLTGLVSVLATLIFSYLHKVVFAQLEDFNRELKETSDRDGLSSTLGSLAVRHSALLQLCATLAHHTSTFATIAMLASLLANVNVLYIIMALTKGLPAFSTAATFLWVIGSLGLIIVTISPMSNVQKELYKSTAIIVNDASIAENTEKTVLANLMVQRIEKSPTQIVLMDAFPVGKNTSHLIMFIAPNVATILAMLYKAITYQ